MSAQARRAVADILANAPTLDPRIAVPVDPDQGGYRIVCCAPEDGLTERGASEQYAAEILAAIEAHTATTSGAH